MGYETINGINNGSHASSLVRHGERVVVFADAHPGKLRDQGKLQCIKAECDAAWEKLENHEWTPMDTNGRAVVFMFIRGSSS